MAVFVLSRTKFQNGTTISIFSQLHLPLTDGQPIPDFPPVLRYFFIEEIMHLFFLKIICYGGNLGTFLLTKPGLRPPNGQFHLSVIHHNEPLPDQ